MTTLDEQQLGMTIRRQRIDRDLDQRDLAEIAGVSLSALRRLESGGGSTVRSMLAVCAALDLPVVLGDEGTGETAPRSGDRTRVTSPTSTRPTLERREDRVALELHRAVVRRLRREPARVREIARHNIHQLRESVRGDVARAWVDEWDNALDGPTSELVDLCLREDEHGVDLRQVGPFLGVLDDDERLAAITRARSW